MTAYSESYSVDSVGYPKHGIDTDSTPIVIITEQQYINTAKAGKKLRQLEVIVDGQFEYIYRADSTIILLSAIADSLKHVVDTVSIMLQNTQATYNLAVQSADLTQLQLEAEIQRSKMWRRRTWIACGITGAAITTLIIVLIKR